MTLADDDPRHGTENGYGNLDCRCAACTEAHRLYYQWKREQHPEYRARQNRRRVERYYEQREDPEWREKQNAGWRESYWRRKLGE